MLGLNLQLHQKIILKDLASLKNGVRSCAGLYCGPYGIGAWT